MSAAGMGTGGCRPGPSPGAASGTCNPRKFSEKIALHNQRQAEETAAFQEVMLDITSTRIQAQKERLAQNQGPCYGGSLPNVNQIGRSNPEFQGQFISDLDSARQTRHHGLVERVQRDRRPVLSGAPYRRRRDCPTYSSAYLSPAPSLSWRRTNSDSALHTSVMNPHAGIHSSPGHALTHRNRRSMFPYPVPPIEENVLDEESLLKSWDAKKLTAPTSRPKSCEVPGINILPSPAQQSGTPLNPATLSTGGSLPDLTNLHLPSPMPSQKEELGCASLCGGGSTGNLAATLTQLGITADGTFSLPGLSTPLQGTFSNSMLQSSLSHPNIQSSLSCHSSHDSLSSTSLQSSLSNPSLQSSLSSSPSLPSSLSNQSLHSSLSSSSLSGKSLQSAANNHSFSSGIGGSGSCSSSSSYSSLLGGQQGPSLTTSPRRRNQLSPLKLSVGTESRWHPSKQFSPTMSPTLSSITQGVALDTSKLPVDQRLPSYPYGQVQQSHLCPQQSAHPGTMMTHLQQPQQSDLQHQPQHHPQQQQQHHLQQHQHQQQHHLQQQNLEQPQLQKQQQHQQQHKHQLPYQKQTNLQQDQQQHQIIQQQQQEQEHHQQQHLQQSGLHQSGQQHLEPQHQQYPQLPGLHNASQQPQWLQFQPQQQPQNQLQVQAPHRGLEQQRQVPGMHRVPATLPLHMESSQNLLSPQRRAPESASQPGLNCGRALTGRPPLSVPNPQATMDQLLTAGLPPSASQSLPANLDLQSEASLLSSLLDEPFVNLRLPGRQGQELSQQLRRFYMETSGSDRSFGQAGGSETGKDEASPMDSHSATIHQLLNQQNQSQNFSTGSHKNPNILLSGNSTPVLSKEITCTLSSMPGFEGDPFGLDDPLRMDPLVLEGLGLLEDGELVLADPAVEDSFRSERFH
ncbi:uncharacterized protein [Paramormyrops kingsleyae]|uniref:CREB regulated transcription coactivator 2 n=1 Tax=Paramormyrops kingsleyae TaxID=1676925 RepID=A0A3B3RYF8_9TELE|nr:CREB-regulated transcription coactivator 2-like isoform X2 [Paramormyrops kingsleyae]